MPAWKKVITSGSNATLNQVTASIVSARSITGSLLGTASFVTGSVFTSTNPALSASYALTASYALNAGGGVGFPFSGSAQITGSLGVTGSINSTGTFTASLSQGYIWVGGAGNITTLLATSSFGNTGSNRKFTQSTPATTWSFNHNLSEQYPVVQVYDLSGAALIPGRIETVDASNLIVYFDDATSGIVVATVGGTVTAIVADSASFVTSSNVWGPFGSNSILSSSYALTASYALNAGGGTGVGFPFSGSAQITGSLGVTGSITATGGLTGSLTASSLQGAINNSQLRNSSVTVGSTNIALGATATTITGLTSVNSTSVTASIVSASQFTGSLFGTSSWALTSSHAINIYVSGSITNADSIQFNTTPPSIAIAPGKMLWDSGEGTLQLGLAGGNVDLNLGEQLYQYVYNAEATPLTLGTVVYVSSSQGGRIAVKRASATAEQGSANTLGFAAEAIGAGAEGWVMTEGSLRGVDTTGYTPGGLIFLSESAGQYTNQFPQAPLHSVRLGYAQKIDASGIIYIKIDNGYEIDELHDIKATNATSGDLLVRSGSLWINSKQLTGSYALTGSLTVINGGITSSLFGTSSWAGNVVGGYVASFNTRQGAVTLASTDISGLGAGIISSSTFSSPSQGTLRATINGTQTDVDLGLQIGDSPTFTNATITNDLTVQGNLTARQFIVSSSVYYVTTSFSSGSTQFGNSLDDTHQFTGSLRVQGSITGSISASNLVGAITNAQLANSSVTIGSTAVSLGGTATTIAGLTSLSSTSLTGSLTASSLQGTITNAQITNPSVTIGSTNVSLGATATTITGLTSLTSTNITGSNISASNGFTGSLSASFLQGLINNTQLRNSSVTVTAGAGLTTGGSVSLGGSVTLDAVAGAGISLTAPTNDAINIDTGSVHFLDGVKKELNTDAVLSGSVSSPSQGTINVGGFTNIDLGLQTTDDVTFNRLTATNGLTGSLTASSLVGLINNTQLRNSSVTVGSTNISLGGTATSITGLSSVSATDLTGSLTASSLKGDIILGTQTSGDYVRTLTQGTGVTITSATGEGSNPTIAIGQAVATTSNVQFANVTASIVSSSFGFTGSLSASFLQGAINNSQLRNSTISGISLGGNLANLTQGTGVTAFTYNGGTSATVAIGQDVGTTANVTFGTVTGTNGLTGSLTASSLQGLITNTQLRNSSVTIGSTNISLGGTSTTIAGLTSVTSTGGFTGSLLGTASYVTGSIFTTTNPALSASYALTASYALNGGGGGGGTPGGSTTQLQYNNGGSFGGVATATYDGTTLRATGSFTGSFKGDGSGLTNLGFGDTRKLFQNVVATTWSFAHNLAESYPIVTIYDEFNNVVVPGRIESVDENNIKVYFKDPTSGVAAVSVGGNATTASYVANAVTIGTTNLISETTSSLIIGTTTVSRVWTGSYSGAFWDYVVNNSTNYRAGNVMGVWNKAGAAQFTDTSTPDIGDTSQITFSVVISGEYADLRATTTTSGWNVKTFKRSI